MRLVCSVLGELTVAYVTVVPGDSGSRSAVRWSPLVSVRCSSCSMLLLRVVWVVVLLLKMWTVVCLLALMRVGNVVRLALAVTAVGRLLKL